MFIIIHLDVDIRFCYKKLRKWDEQHILGRHWHWHHICIYIVLHHLFIGGTHNFINCLTVIKPDKTYCISLFQNFDVILITLYMLLYRWKCIVFLSKMMSALFCHLFNFVVAYRFYIVYPKSNRAQVNTYTSTKSSLCIMNAVLICICCISNIKKEFDPQDK